MARQKKAKNAYELLERVCEAIKAHPLNYYQATWCAARDTSPHWVDRQLPDELNRPENECGTAFCRAGWIVQLHDGHMPTEGTIDSRAREILGENISHSFDLGDSIDELFFDSADLVDPLTPGTDAYVTAGIDGISQFMDDHAEHLKARSLRGV